MLDFPGSHVGLPWKPGIGPAERGKGLGVPLTRTFQGFGQQLKCHPLHNSWNLTGITSSEIESILSF